jgi:hypothetical protein
VVSGDLLLAIDLDDGGGELLLDVGVRWREVAEPAEVGGGLFGTVTLEEVTRGLLEEEASDEQETSGNELWKESKLVQRRGKENGAKGGKGKRSRKWEGDKPECRKESSTQPCCLRPCSA